MAWRHLDDDEKRDIIRYPASFVLGFAIMFVIGMSVCWARQSDIAREHFGVDGWHYHWTGPMLAVCGFASIIGLGGVALCFLITTRD